MLRKYNFLLFTFLLFQIWNLSLAQEPILMAGWPVLVHNYYLYGAPSQGVTLFDIDDDGRDELLFNIGNKLYCYNIDGNPIPGWPYENENPDEEFDNSPLVGDIDGDGEDEIIVDAINQWDHYARLYAFESDGTICSNFPIDLANNVAFWNLALYDIDEDGILDIIVGVSQFYPDTLSEIRVYRGDGQMLPGWPVEGISCHLGGIAVGDIDNDGYPEIVIAGSNDEGDDLFALKADGNPVAGFPIKWNGGDDVISYSAPVLFDYNNDGYLEIAQLFGRMDPVYVDGQIAVVNHQGEMLPNWPLYFGEKPAVGPSVGWFSWEGESCISFGAYQYGDFYLADMSGNILKGWPFWSGDSLAGCWDQPRIADIDGDGSMDYIFNYNKAIMDSAGWMGRIWALNQDGELLDYFPLWVLGTTFPGGVSLGDIDNDGITEMAFETDYPTFGYPTQRIYVYKLDGITWEPERFPWPMSCHDPQHTNNLTYHPQTGVPYDDQTGLPRTPYLYQNYPNPFNAATTIKFGIPRAGKVKLDLYDLGGRKVAKILEGDYPAGDREIGFDGSGLPSGLYFYRLRFGGKSITRKMILLK